VRLKQSAYKTATSAYAQFTVGYDTNMNSASSEKTFTTPTLGTGTFTEDSLAKEAAFGEISLGGRVTHPIAKGRYLFTGIDLDQRVNDDGKEFDLGSVDIRGGINMVEGDKQLRLTAAGQHLELDYRSYRDQANLTADASYMMSRSLRLNGYLQGGVISYPNLDNRDAYTGSVGLGITRFTKWRFKPSFSAMVFLGKDDPMDSNATSKELADKESIGISLKSRLKLNKGSALDLSLLWQNTSYQGEDSVFLVKRDDDFYKLSVGYTYKINNDWKLKLDASHSRLDSNISINEYERNQVSVSLRYEFR